jgi:hypothetical protein
MNLACPLGVPLAKWMQTYTNPMGSCGAPPMKWTYSRLTEANKNHQNTHHGNNTYHMFWKSLGLGLPRQTQYSSRAQPAPKRSRLLKFFVALIFSRCRFVVASQDYFYLYSCTFSSSCSKAIKLIMVAQPFAMTPLVLLPFL